MKVSSNVVPTPIASTMALQASRVEPVERAPDPVVAAPAPTQPRPEVAPPLTVALGDKKIQLSPNELAKVVDKMNETAQLFNNTLRFEMTQDNRVKIRVIDSNTGQLVREIPPEKLMETFARLEDVVGVLLDQRA